MALTVSKLLWPEQELSAQKHGLSRPKLQQLAGLLAGRQSSCCRLLIGAHNLLEQLTSAVLHPDLQFRASEPRPRQTPSSQTYVVFSCSQAHLCAR